jgi:phosphomannomutase/phosphoglucomutase
VVTPSGEVIYPDRLLMLFARDVLSRNPGAAIIYDVKCTGKLQPLILEAGGSPMMWKTGTFPDQVEDAPDRRRTGRAK